MDVQDHTFEGVFRKLSMRQPMSQHNENDTRVAMLQCDGDNNFLCKGLLRFRLIPKSFEQNAAILDI